MACPTGPGPAPGRSAIAHNGRRVVRIDVRHGRKIARMVTEHLRNGADLILRGCLGVEITHAHSSVLSFGARQKGQ